MILREQEDYKWILNYSLSEVLHDSAERYGDKEAVVFKSLTYPEERITFKEWQHRARKLAQGLRKLGIRKGDHIATLGAADLEWCYYTIALNILGCVQVPLNASLTTVELEYQIKSADVNGIVFLDSLRDKNYYEEFISKLFPEAENGTLPNDAYPLVRILISYSRDRKKYPGINDLHEIIESGEDYEKDDTYFEIEKTCSPLPREPAWIFFTSGTTGLPKGAVLHSQGFLCAASDLVLRMYLTQDDRYVFVPVPHHTVGISCGMGCVLLNGMTGITMEYWHPELVLRSIQEEKATCVVSLEELTNIIRAHPTRDQYNVSSIKKVGCSITPAGYENVKNTFNTDLIAMTYGQTEGHGAQNTADLKDNLEQRKFGQGKPVWGEFKIWDTENKKDITKPMTSGEICFNGPQMFLGYYKNPEATRDVVDKNGYKHTGDLGMKDKYGNFVCLGRTTDTIRQGGEMYNGQEVEEVINKLDDVNMSSVVGVSDDILGQVGFAMVELLPGATLKKEQIIAACKEKLAKFKIPKYVEFVKGENFIMTGTGKLKRKQISEKCAEKIASGSIKKISI